MSLRDGDDPVAVAAAVLSHGAVNADLVGQLGEPPIISTLLWPTALDALGQMQLPALAVWREEDQDTQYSAQHEITSAVFRFDYYLPAQGRPGMGSVEGESVLEAVWPTLRQVWRAIVTSMRRGYHPSVSSGSNLLRPAGVVKVEKQSPRVKYAFVPGGGHAYAGFNGRITIAHREDVDLSGLEDVRDLYSKIVLKTDGEPDVDPIVEDITPKP